MNLSIYIVEDDKETCERFTSIIDSFKELTIIGISDNSTEAYNHILTDKPDVLILDLELNLGEGSGLDLLENISTPNCTKKPYIVVTTNTSNQLVYNHLHTSGVGFIFSKHQKGYSEANVLRHINLIKLQILNAHNQSSPLPVIDKDDIKSIIMSDILNQLDDVGIKSSNLGYKYLSDAIYYVITQGYDKNIYNHLSTLHNKSVSSIEHAIRNAIDSAWSNKNNSKALKNFPVNQYHGKDSPSPGPFICYYAERLKNTHHKLLSSL